MRSHCHVLDVHVRWDSLAFRESCHADGLPHDGRCYWPGASQVLACLSFPIASRLSDCMCSHRHVLDLHIPWAEGEGCRAAGR